jgi:hypothetical protein
MTAGLFLLAGVVFYSLWRQQRFDFVKGHEPVCTVGDGQAYELAADFDELKRKIGKHLARHLFILIAVARYNW